MHPASSRVVQWKEQEVQIREIPITGVADGNPQGECEPAHALVYAGHGRTNAAGSWTVFLPAISCLKPAPGGDHPASIVATPTTFGHTDDIPRPFVLVARVHGAHITIWSFDVNGERAPNVEFSWHCVIEGTLV